jgi:hypothetical protein
MTPEPRKPSDRAPYEPPVLRPLKLFVEAATPGCCKATLATCSGPMKTSGAGSLGKATRTSTTS